MSGLIPTNFYLASYIAIRLGLKENYFKEVYRKNIDSPVEFKLEYEKFLYVKLPDKLNKLLNENYLCNQIKINEIDDYDYIFRLSSRCLIGLWK